MYDKPAEQLDAEIWRKYNESHDPELRNTIVMHYAYIVKYTVMQMRSMFKNYAEQEDLMNEGLVALMESIDKYDIDREIKFETYASIRVKGAIIDYIRKQDWVPRRIRKTAKDIENAISELWCKNNRQPTDEELAEHLGVTVDELHANMAQTYAANVVSFEEVVQEGFSLAENLASLKNKSIEDHPEDSLFSKELRQTITETIENLPEKERLVVAMYYYENLKLKEIAEVIGVSESRVCQIHSSAIIKLKRTIGEYIRN